MIKYAALLLIIVGIGCSVPEYDSVRQTENFTKNWEFTLDEIAKPGDINDQNINWRTLNLPHDWSIEGEFSPDHPATVGGGALPGGIGWYRKEFFVPESDSAKHISIRFDGVYMNSDVWINGEHLGHRPNGYIGIYLRFVSVFELWRRKRNTCKSR